MPTCQSHDSQSLSFLGSQMNKTRNQERAFHCTRASAVSTPLYLSGRNTKWGEVVKLIFILSQLHYTQGR